MAIRFYDEALVGKIKKWTKEPNLRILKPDEVTRLFQTKADFKDDQPLSLPLIAISREPNVDILSTNKKPLSFQGLKLDSNEKKVINLNAIPIKIGYQIDIYTRHYAEGDEYLRNFIFNLVNYPKLSVQIPYNNVDLEHNANIQIIPTVEDNSDIKERLFSDQFTRWTIKLIIDDAYLFSVPFKDTISLDIESTELEIINKK